jgi:hypothetical protein
MKVLCGELFWGNGCFPNLLGKFENWRTKQMFQKTVGLSEPMHGLREKSEQA